MRNANVGLNSVEQEAAGIESPRSPVCVSGMEIGGDLQSVHTGQVYYSVPLDGSRTGLAVIEKPIRPASMPVTVSSTTDLAPNPGHSLNDTQNMELQRIHQIMRGRYHWAILLLVIGAIAGAVAGFKGGKKLYASAGLVRVMPVVPKVLFSVDDKGTIPMFDSFVESQAAVLRSQRVMDMAMQDPAWQLLGRGISDKAAEDFAEQLTVSHEGEVLRVQVMDADPKAAMIGVRTLIDAYQKIYSEQDASSDGHRLEILVSRQTALSADLATKRQQILDIAKAYGSDDLKSLHAFKQEQVNKLDLAIAEKQMLLSESARSGSTTRPSNLKPTVEQLATVSLELRTLLSEQHEYEMKLKTYRAQNLLPRNNLILETQSLLQTTNDEIQLVEAQLQKEWASGNAVVAGTSGTVDEQKIDEEVKSLQGLRDNMVKDLFPLGQQMLQIEELRTQANEVQSERDETKHRMDQLTLEASVSGRINVLSTGDRPLAPAKDTRVPLCAAGGFGGGIFGFSIVAVMAMMDRRLRSPDQADGGRLNAPMLGMLPRLPNDLSDPAQAAMAAHCVHEIRTLLQIWSRRSSHRVFAITSPDPAAGKTSLTLALGASYATANLRTLVVDCDLIAGGLTQRVDAIVKQKLGQILHREGLVTDEQIAEALKLASHRSGRIGEILVEQGYLTDADLARAVRMQDQEPVGILDAMRGMPLDECIAETGIPNLQILQVGTATARDVPLLSPEGLHRLIESLGRRFDVVLVDTGPILGSLEASLVAGIVDGVVLTVCKGERRQLVERAMSQLVTVGARVAGVVFNGASQEDITFYGSSNRRRSGTIPSGASVESYNGTTAPDASRLGPLTAAVVTCAPSSGRGSIRHGA